MTSSKKLVTWMRVYLAGFDDVGVWERKVDEDDVPLGRHEVCAWLAAQIGGLIAMYWNDKPLTGFALSIYGPQPGLNDQVGAMLPKNSALAAALVEGWVPVGAGNGLPPIGGTHCGKN